MYVVTKEGNRKVSYEAVTAAAKRIDALVIARHRSMARAAGLDPQLLGIHPHNAMCSLHYGKPWPEVDYRICKRLDWEQKQGFAFRGYRIADELSGKGRVAFAYEC